MARRGIIEKSEAESMTKKVMELINENSGLMQCRFCGAEHLASLKGNTESSDVKSRFYRGTWQCHNGCKLD